MMNTCFPTHTLPTRPQLWDAGLNPGDFFDLGTATPQLTALIATGGLDLSSRRLLVPGCGRGYDVNLAARSGASAAVGLDLAPSAVRDAERHRDETEAAEVAARARYVVGARCVLWWGWGWGWVMEVMWGIRMLLFECRGLRRCRLSGAHQVTTTTTPITTTIAGDFFTYKDPGGLFDCGWDYTFLYADS